LYNGRARATHASNASVRQGATHTCVSGRFSVFSFSFFNKSLSLSHDHPYFIVFKTRHIVSLGITDKFRADYIRWNPTASPLSNPSTIVGKEIPFSLSILFDDGDFLTSFTLRSRNTSNSKSIDG
jgi:hypothetical protein